MLRLPYRARRLVVRAASLQCPAQRDLLSRALIPSTQRFFATPGRPRTAVGEPSKTVKRAVKRQAKTPDSSTTTAKRKTPAKKKATGARASAAKKKPKAKKAKKVLTPKQKEAREARKAKDKITELRKAALSPPSSGATLSAYTIFFAEKSRGPTAGPPGSQAQKDRARSIASEWKAVTPAELEHYNHLAEQERQKRQDAYKLWVESHSPDQIQAANRARILLKRKLPKRKQAYSKIKDERAVKGPLSGYIQFSIDRHASGDFKNIRVADRAKLIGQEWKALTESEKKKYKDRQSEDHNRYVSEYSSVYGTPPPATQVASAAA